MLCGLQGSGKTTTCGKLARLLAAQGRKPLLVAADLQRPAAVEQLKVIGQQLQIPVYSEEQSDPVSVCQHAVVEANRQARDTIILDTAGRLHVDDELMAELQQIEKKVKPHQVFFVCDAMTGQDAVASRRGLQQGAGTRRRDPHQARRRRPRRRGAVRPQGDGRADQVRRHRREARQAHGVRPAAARRPDARHGRHRRPGRGRAGRRRSGRGEAPAGKARQGQVRPQRLPQADRADEEDGLGQAS